MLKPLTNRNIKYNHQLLKEQNKNKMFERTSVIISRGKDWGYVGFFKMAAVL